MRAQKKGTSHEAHPSYEFELDDNQTSESKTNLADELGDLRFRYLLPPEKWQALPAQVRGRFSKRLRKNEVKFYQGYVTHTHMTKLGWVLAQTLRIIGAPLPLAHHDDERGAMVCVSETQEGQGQIWSRHYERPGKFPQTIHSCKQFSGPTGLEEYVGFGFGMSLKLDVKDETLLFKSAAYYIKIWNWRIGLPSWFSLGALTVSHADHGDCWGDSWFEFGLDLVHPWFGALLSQRIMFRDC